MKSKADAWKNYGQNKSIRATSSSKASTTVTSSAVSPTQIATFERVKKIVMTQLDISADEIQMNSNIVDDLGADSLDIVELIMAVEEEYNIEIPDERAEKMKTVGDVVNYILRG